MCVEEEGDGRLLGEVLAQSFISSCIGLPFLFISLCRALRDVFFSDYLLLSGSASLLMLTTPSFLLFSLFCSLLRMDEGECAARNSVHRSLQHWQGWPVSSSVSDAPGGSTLDSPRRADLRPARRRQVAGWTSQKSFCFCSSAKQPLDQTSTHCTASHDIQDMHFVYFECCFVLKLDLLPPHPVLTEKTTYIDPYFLLDSTL